MPEERRRTSRNPRSFRPFGELEDLRRQFEEDIIRPAMRAVWERIPEEVRGWSPSIDVFEKGDNLEVKVEIPGIKQQDIALSVSDDTLIIKGERRPDADIKEEDYYRSEIDYGSFYRSIALPSNIDTDNIEAAYEEGMLRVTLHRVSGAKAKKINIQIKKGTSGT